MAGYGMGDHPIRYPGWEGVAEGLLSLSPIGSFCQGRTFNEAHLNDQLWGACCRKVVGLFCRTGETSTAAGSWPKPDIQRWASWA